MGQYTAMSIMQGGCGFPFLAEPVFDYISTGKYTGIQVDVADVPDVPLKFVLEKVNVNAVSLAIDISHCVM